jgi:hypothetical protein
LPDEWQTRYFGEEDPDALPHADPDRDGQDNEAEYVAGTDPTDPDSRLRFAVATATGERLRFEVSPYTAARDYIMETRPDAVSGTFVKVEGIDAGVAGSKLTLATARPAGAAGFYRLSVRIR